MKSYLLLLVFCGEVAAEKLFKCGDNPPCKITQCCIDEKTCGVCPAHDATKPLVIGDGSPRGAVPYTTEAGFPSTLKNPRHIASPTYAGFAVESKEGLANDMTDFDGTQNPQNGADTNWKYDLGQWKKWTTAARNNKDLHWDVIMGTMYTKHIEKEQKTLERLSNDVKSQLNSMYLGKGPRCKQTDPGNPATKFCTFSQYQNQASCERAVDRNTGYIKCEWEPADPISAQSPIQISMKDTKDAYTALVDCLKASVSSNDYPTYLDLVQKRGSDVDSTQYRQYAAQDRASFGEDNDLTNYPARRRLLDEFFDPSLNTDNHTTDYLLLLKTKQAHYNLQSSYECSNEEMNFEVRLYKMSKLENRYKLLYLYCKCDLTTQIKKFMKMVETLCTGAVSDVSESGHCYEKSGTTTKRSARDSTRNLMDHWAFRKTIAESECNIDEAFCPEHVFYYTATGVVTPHPQAPCSTCVDLGGEHSKITQNPNNDEDKNHRFSGIKWTGTIRRNFNEF